jgi:hypothetical protein
MTAKKVIALVVGVLFGTVQLLQFKRLPVPSNAEAVGYDGMWIILLAGAIFLVAYGAGLYPRRKKTD